jgi:hypothetical protein
VVARDGHEALDQMLVAFAGAGQRFLPSATSEPARGRLDAVMPLTAPAFAA